VKGIDGGKMVGLMKCDEVGDRIVVLGEGKRERCCWEID
jgi:hypothetical protein